MNNPVKPVPWKILEENRKQNSNIHLRWRPILDLSHGQSRPWIPEGSEAPISVSAYGDGWIERTPQSVGRSNRRNL